MFMGMLSAYSFYVVGRMCDADGADSLTDLWKQNIGKGSEVVNLSILIFTMGAALTYSIVLGDAFSSLAETLGLQGWLIARQTSILAITLTALWPLCNLKNLAALAPFSVVGVVGTIVTCLFMVLRCVQPSGPYRLPDGAFLSTLAPAFLPSFGTKGIRNMLSPASLVLASMCNCAFTAHYSAGDFYNVLGGRNSGATLSKFKKLVWFGFGGVFAINAAILVAGFLTFGGACKGIVLNNYSTADFGATVCRLLMALCVVGGFPFLINASRKTLFEMLDSGMCCWNCRCLYGRNLILLYFLSFLTLGEKVSKEEKRKVTRGLVSLITGLALVLEDAGVVVSFNGAVMGSAIIYIFPALIFLKSTKIKMESGAVESTRKLKVERFVNRFLVGFGVVSAIVGGAVIIIAKYFPQLLRS